MDRNSNTYTFIFAVIMVIVVATILSVIAMVLQPRQRINIELEKKRNILSAIQIKSDAKTADELFDKYIIEIYAVSAESTRADDIDAFDIEMRNELRKAPEEMNLPVFVAKLKDNSTKYILALYGAGLWGPLWGYIALHDDMNTIYGVYFTHQAETPGLGAEIDTESYQRKFIGKKIFDEFDEFVSIDIIKGKVSEDDLHAVDAISGGTITCLGLRDMIRDCLKLYLNYIESNRNKEKDVI